MTQSSSGGVAVPARENRIAGRRAPASHKTLRAQPLCFSFMNNANLSHSLKSIFGSRYPLPSCSVRFHENENRLCSGEQGMTDLGCGFSLLSSCGSERNDRSHMTIRWRPSARVAVAVTDGSCSGSGSSSGPGCWLLAVAAEDTLCRMLASRRCVTPLAPVSPSRARARTLCRHMT